MVVVEGLPICTVLPCELSNSLMFLLYQGYYSCRHYPFVNGLVINDSKEFLAYYPFKERMGFLFTFSV